MSRVMKRKVAAAGGGAGLTLVGLITDNGDGTFDFPGGTAVGDICSVFEFQVGASNGGSAIAPSGFTVANDGTEAYAVLGGDYIGYYGVLSSTSTVTSAYLTPTTNYFVGAVYTAGSTITVSSVNDVGAEQAINPASQALNASGSTGVLYCGMARPSGQYSASFTPDTSMASPGSQFGGAWLYQATGTNETWDDDGTGGSETIISYWLEVTA